MNRLRGLLGAAALAVASLGSSAWAGVTAVNPVPDWGASGTQSLLSILKSTYDPGGAAPVGSIATSLTFSNGIVVTRVQDTGLNGDPSSPTMGLGTGDLSLNNDQLWHDGTTTFTAEAKYATYHQTFGYKLGSNPDVTVMSDTSGSGNYGPVFIGPGTFRWWRSGDLSNNLAANKWYSDQALNGNEDHMVTFLVTKDGYALKGDRTWILAWEDVLVKYADHDYNDLVVEVVAVPVPASVWMGLSTLVALGVASYLRHRRAKAAV